MHFFCFVSSAQSLAVLNCGQVLNVYGVCGDVTRFPTTERQFIKTPPIFVIILLETNQPSHWPAVFNRPSRDTRAVQVKIIHHGLFLVISIHLIL